MNFITKNKKKETTNVKRNLIIPLIILMFGCSSPKPFEIKEVCKQSEGTDMILHGFLSLPKTIDTIQLIKDRKVTAVGYQIFLMTKTDATGDAVKVTLWTTDKAEPNKIKAFSDDYDWKDLLVYTDDGKKVPAGKIIKLTGETVADEKSGCAVSVTKIELPEGKNL